jgi:ELWxxDGT repeat protein
MKPIASFQGLFLAFASVLASAGAPQLVRDINEQVITVSGRPGSFRHQGNWLFLAAHDPGGPRALWATDGTASGTRLLSRGTNIPLAVEPQKAGSHTYFVASTPSGFERLWASDGTAQGTVDLTGQVEGLDSITLIGALGQSMAFQMYLSGVGRQLWISDGTRQGTRALTAVGEVDAYGLADDVLYYFSIDAGGEASLSRTDGTASGTEALGNALTVSEGSFISSLVQAGDDLVFIATTDAEGTEPWRIDTPTGTVTLIEDIVAGPTSGATQGFLDSGGDFAVFHAEPAGPGSEALWTTDGSAPGTHALAPTRMVAYDGRLLSGPLSGGRHYFHGEHQSPAVGDAIWLTDGATAEDVFPDRLATLIAAVGNSIYVQASATPGDGTARLWRVRGSPDAPEMLGGLPADAASFEVAGEGNVLYVRTRGAQSGNRIYRYNFPNATPLLVYSYVEAGSDGSSDGSFALFQGRLLFDAYLDADGRELFATDGTTSGTRLLKNLAADDHTLPSAPASFTALGATAAFTADDGVHGREIWVSDGTAAATRLLLDAVPGIDGSQIGPVFSGAGGLFFFARGADNLDHLWFSRNAASAPTAVADLAWVSAGPCSAPVDVDGIAYFAALGTTGEGIWRSDGTPAGTRRADVPRGDGRPRQPCEMVRLGNQLIFSDTYTAGSEPHALDLATGQVRMIADLLEGTGSSSPRDFVVWNDAVYFTATAGDRRHLFVTRGDAASTQSLTDDERLNDIQKLHALPDLLLFAASENASGYRLWKSDGTAAGTAAVNEFTIHPETATLLPRGLLFMGAPSTEELRLWITDGTVAGTLAVRDLYPGASEYAIDFVNFNGVVFFTAVTGEGPKPWRSNGTSDGTWELDTDQWPRFPVEPGEHVVTGDIFFFAYNDPLKGVELFAFENEAPQAAADSNVQATAGRALEIDVLANDEDADGALDPSTLVIMSEPEHGTASVTSGGRIRYVPNATYAGSDSLEYAVADDQGRMTTTAVVSITVTAAPEEEPRGGGGGGGLSLVELAVMMLSLLALRFRNTSLTGYAGRKRSS